MANKLLDDSKWKRPRHVTPKYHKDNSKMDYNVLFVKLMQYCLIDGKITIDKAYNFMKKTGNVLIMSIAKKLYYNEITKTDAASLLSSYLNELDDDD